MIFKQQKEAEANRARQQTANGKLYAKKKEAEGLYLRHRRQRLLDD